MTDDVPVSDPAITIFPPRAGKSARTICVLGVPRGGTSMVAGILRHLGVPMGLNIENATNEDRAFLNHRGERRLFWDPNRSSDRDQYISSILTLIEQRNTAFPTWGWKDPIALYYIREILPALRNICFIVVTRDPGAVAQRERLSEAVASRRKILDYMRICVTDYNRIMELILERSCPTLLVSYERTLRAPVKAGLKIAQFAGWEVPPGFEEWLTGYISGDRRDGSITKQPAARSLANELAASPDLDLLIDEGQRVRRDGLLGPKDVSTTAELKQAGDALYQAGVARLNLGDPQQAEDHAFSILHMYSREFPFLLNGAIGVLGQEVAGSGIETATSYPDHVGAAFYLLGMAAMLSGNARRALMNFSIAEAVMRARIERGEPNSILSEGNYWNCLLHRGIAAKVMRRVDVRERVKSMLLAKETELPQTLRNLRARPAFEAAVKRAQREL